MGVYKPAASRFYQYDFQYKNRRYSGSTNVTTLKKAEKVEEKVRADVALGLYDDKAQMTLDDACGRWWSEKGQHLATGKPKAMAKKPAATKARLRKKAKPGEPPLSDVERRLGIVIRLLGAQTRLVDIGSDEISKAIETRRGETYQKTPDRPATATKPAFKAKRYPVSNGTVNADIIITLQRIMNRARKTWEVAPLKVIDWGELRLKEPEPEIRVYTAAQRTAWRDQCDPVAGRQLDILLRYGLRLNELFFPPDAFIPAEDGAPAALAINKRKRGVMMMPLRTDDAADLAARVGRAKAAGLDTIWFEEVVTGEGEGAERVILEPMTYYGSQARLRSAAARAGITLPRVIHGSRHHAATVFLSKSKNIKLTQALLGHADIKSTQRYAHAMNHDLWAALEADGEIPKPQNSPEAKPKRVRKTK